MFTILPVRKLMKVVSSKRRLAKRERAPTSPTEGLDKNVFERSHWQIYFFVFILFLFIFFIFLPEFYNNRKYAYSATYMSSEEAHRRSRINGPVTTLPVCFLDVLKLGFITVNESVTEISETDYPAVQRGGYYTPEDCRSRHKVALLVPYRDRKENLAAFIFNIHPFLMKQKLEYRIFIIEQKGTELFNRGRIFNAGFKEAKKYGGWQCVVLHDVDLLPLDERILYTCPIWPRHMCAKIVETEEKKKKKPGFHTYFGGVSIMTRQHFEKVNGFSNLYWGWGGEDTDLYWRIRGSGLPVVTYNRKIATYTSLNHSEQVANTFRYALLKTADKRFPIDGLSTLQYAVESVTLHRLYTHIVIDISPKKNLNKSCKNKKENNNSIRIG